MIPIRTYMDFSTPELNLVRQGSSPLPRLSHKPIQNLLRDPGPHLRGNQRLPGDFILIGPLVQLIFQPLLELWSSVSRELYHGKRSSGTIRQKIIIHGFRIGISIHGKMRKRVVLPDF